MASERGPERPGTSPGGAAPIDSSYSSLALPTRCGSDSLPTLDVSGRYGMPTTRRLPTSSAPHRAQADQSGDTHSLQLSDRVLGRGKPNLDYSRDIGVRLPVSA